MSSAQLLGTCGFWHPDLEGEGEGVGCADALAKEPEEAQADSGAPSLPLLVLGDVGGSEVPCEHAEERVHLNESSSNITTTAE